MAEGAPIVTNDIVKKAKLVHTAHNRKTRQRRFK